MSLRISLESTVTKIPLFTHSDTTHVVQGKDRAEYTDKIPLLAE